jgi:hypothetical protein
MATTVVESIVQPDESAIKAHLVILFAPLREEYPGGLVEICYGSTAPNQAAYFNLHDDGLTGAASFAAARNRAGENIYIGVNPRKPSTSTRHRASDSDVEIAVWQFADIDKAESLQSLGRNLRPLPPFFTIDSGTVPHRRPHLYWRLSEPVWNMAPWTERQSGIAAALGGDAVINPSRIMRLAGTVNFPPQHKLQRGYAVERTTLKTQFEDERDPVSPEEIAAAFPPRVTETVTPSISAGQTTLSTMRPTRIHDLIEACRSGSEWHNHMIRLVGHLAAIGRTSAEILALADHITLPGYSSDQTYREMLTALQSARSKWALPEPDDVPVEDEEKKREEAARDLEVVDAFDFDEADIPVRPWLVPGALLAGYTHMLAAPGGSGKSLFTLQFAIALATGTQWGSFTPRRRYKSLVVNVEDDIDEQRRRLSAAARVMGIDPTTLRGWIYLVDGSQGIVVAGHDPVKRSLVMMPVAAKLRTFIEKNEIDVLWADPFAETFEGDENDNSEVKWAMKIWRDEIARPTKAAVYLVHHTTKYAANGAGDANVIRGAGAIVNSTRISATLMPMTGEEATALGVDQQDRHLYVRYDDAKANQSLKTNSARWFSKETVELTNGKGLQEPDEVGALVPWSPPDAFEGLSLASINMVLDKIEEGLVDEDGVLTGVRYTSSTRGGSKASGRWVGGLFMEFLGMKEAQAKKVIATWIATGVLVEQNYHCPKQRSERNGLFAPYDKRPGADG